MVRVVTKVKKGYTVTPNNSSTGGTVQTVFVRNVILRNIMVMAVTMISLTCYIVKSNNNPSNCWLVKKNHIIY